MQTKNEVALFGGGCFWCTEAVFRRLKGVSNVTSGYAGGKKESPSYYDVVEGNTGHAEVIRVEFDPDLISYKTLLDVFFDFHDPTTLNRQGNDSGTQYRSIVFYKDNTQKTQVLDKLEELKKSLSRSVVTELQPFDTFYDAESYHQQYYDKNSYQPYCSVVISPKIKHLEEKYASILK